MSLKTRTPLTPHELEQRRRALRAMVAIAAPVAAQVEAMDADHHERAQGNEPRALKKDDPPGLLERANNLPGWAGSDAVRGSFPCALLFWLPALCRWLTCWPPHGQLHPLRARQAAA